jgi:alpha-mannosidase
MEFEYAICPHKGDYETDSVFRLAYEFKNRPLISSLMYKPYELPGKKQLPLNLSYIDIDSDNIIISAIKKAESDEALVIRCFNLTVKEQSDVIRLYKNISKVFRTNMKEENIEAIKLTGKNCFRINIKPKKIETFKIFF